MGLIFADIFLALSSIRIISDRMYDSHHYLSM